VYSADPKIDLSNYRISGRSFPPKNDFTIPKNSEYHTLVVGDKPSYKGQNHVYKNNLYGYSFVFAIRCRAKLSITDYCSPREG
jgi:hypothetical protein